MEKIIGRDAEIQKLREWYDSDKNEFIALYGRRRVGKTFLVKSSFSEKIDFYASGVIDGSMEIQIEAFNNALARYGYKGQNAKTWTEAFTQLADLLEAKSRKKKSRIVVFLDELPCFDTPRSGFLPALDQFWNSRASWLNNIYLIVCGSATSWMIQNIVNNKAGLHKRTTHTMHLRPFTLGQTEEYLKSRRFHWPRIAVLQIYMVLGGVPYYLSLLDNKKNVPDNIDTLFFSQESEFENEFGLLFGSLFKNADSYMEIIRLLANKRDGYTRSEIASVLQIPDNGHFSKMLDDLEYCDFIRRYNNGLLQKNGIYQLVDLFSLFYLKFCTRRITDEHFWRNALGTSEQNAWYGLTFERVCLLHIRQIIHGLHLDTIRHEYYAWRSKGKPSVQIDLLIDRADNIATICEMKYSKDDYSLSEKEYRNIIRRIEAFQSASKRKNGVQVAIVTTYGLTENIYSEISPVAITMNELFE